MDRSIDLAVQHILERDAKVVKKVELHQLDTELMGSSNRLKIAFRLENRLADDEQQVLVLQNLKLMII